MTIRNNLDHYYEHVGGQILEDEVPRNMLTLDQFFGYIISRGVPVQFCIGMADKTATETRTYVTLVLKMPNPYLQTADKQASYVDKPFAEVGPTLGHALQRVYDKLEMEV